MRDLVSELVQAQEKLHQHVLWRVAAERRDSWGSESAGVMEAFQVGDYVLMAQPRKIPEFVSQMDWAAESSLQGKHAHTVEGVVSKQRVQAHIARMRPYSDASL